MKSSMVVKAFHDHLTNHLNANQTVFANLTKSVRQDIPGDNFEAEKVMKEFIEPRVSESIHPNESRPQEETDFYTVTIRCFVKEQRRGGRNTDNIPDLERLIDLVRGAVDPSLGPVGTAPVSIRILDYDVSPASPIGTLKFGEVRIIREYGVTITVGEQTLNDIDLATMTVQIYVSGLAGEDC